MDKKEKKIIEMLAWTAFIIRMYLDEVPLEDLKIEKHMTRLKIEIQSAYENFASKKLSAVMEI